MALENAPTSHSRFKRPSAGSLMFFSLGMVLMFLLLTAQASLKAVNNPPPAQPNLAQEVRGNCKSNRKRLVLDLNPTGSGGARGFTPAQVRVRLAHPLTYGVLDDLRAFTGLSDHELMNRLTRTGTHHFEIEHQFYGPKSSRELALYYRSSVAYLWANSMHPSIDHSMLDIKPEDGPILDYSGGVGSSCIGLAMRGVKCVYFGIGQMEFEFAQFRVQRQGLSHLVSFVKPYSRASTKDGISGYHFDPIKSLELGATIPEKLGGVFALDVFEHIPNYHVTAAHLVSLIRPGGRMFENTEFNRGSRSNTDIHLKASVPLRQALAGMRFMKKVWTNPAVQVWVKERA